MTTTLEPYHSSKHCQIYCGDALQVLKTLATESVDMVLTSPPYWHKRDNGVDGQIGLEAIYTD
jgi:DNA modification methylase